MADCRAPTGTYSLTALSENLQLDLGKERDEETGRKGKGKMLESVHVHTFTSVASKWPRCVFVSLKMFQQQVAPTQSEVDHCNDIANKFTDIVLSHRNVSRLQDLNRR